MGPDDEDLGGDPACWLSLVCEECGQVIDTDDHHCPTAPEPSSG